MDQFIEFFRKLYYMLLRKQTLDDSEILVFIVGCSIMGLFIVTADMVSFHVKSDKRKKSLLSLKYSNGKSIFRNYLFWGMGSAILGYLSTIVYILKMNACACLVVAVSWPIIFAKIIEAKGAPEVEQTPNDRT